MSFRKRGIKKFFWLGLIAMMLLSGCSGIPLRLKSAADKSMQYINSEMAVAIEGSNHLTPILTEAYQISTEEWCLTYELGPNFHFSSRWVKQEQNWVRVELHPYVDHCNWARY